MRESVPLTEGTDEVTRRELNSEISHVIELQKRDVEIINGKLALIDEKIAARDRDLNKQAGEYERRLGQLNGETGRIQNVLEKSIPREVFENYVREANGLLQALKENFAQQINSNKMEFDKQLKEISDWKIKQEGSLRVILWLVGIAVAIFIGVLVTVLKSK